MFRSYYSMTRNPFDKNSIVEKDAFPSNDHDQTIHRLSYLKDVRAVGVFTSPAGYGKTFALRCFTRSLNQSLFASAYICLTTVSVTEFYRQLCYSLGIDPPHGKPAMFRVVQERLYHLLKEKKRPFLLIIDEAHELSSPILKDLKMIMNFDFDSTNCFTLVLAGEPHLNNILDKPVHEALRQRVAVSYNFTGLSDTELEQYLHHKLQLAGASPDILGVDTLPGIIAYSRGAPRLVDNLMTKALMLGAQTGKPILDAEIIMASVNDLALS